jgi:hypothetical protein
MPQKTLDTVLVFLHTGNKVGNAEKVKNAQAY